MIEPQRTQRTQRFLGIIVHRTEESGYWAEVAAIPGCASQGETLSELLQNISEASEGCKETL
jgi:predicted RNase H-like HicB family nuclease